MYQPSQFNAFLVESRNGESCDKNDAFENLEKIKSQIIKSYHTCFLMDHNKMDFLCAVNKRGYFKHCEEHFIDHGFNSAIEMIHPDDLSRQYQIFKDYLKIFCTLPKKDKKNFTFCNDLRCIGKDGRYRWLLQSINLIEMNEKGLPKLSISSYVDITSMKTNDCMSLFVGKYDKNGIYKIRNTIKYPLKSDFASLSRKEIKILKMISEGLLSKHIAEKLNLSFHTINTHRRNMLKKTCCNTSSEMVNLARDYGII